MKPDSNDLALVLPVMAMDILSNVLHRADNPGNMGTYLTEEVRNLTGAHCVLLIQRLVTPTVAEQRVVSVYPLRRREWAESPPANRLFEIVQHLPAAQLWAGKEPSEVAGLLQREGFELSMFFPLIAGGFRVGSMLALGLPDEEHIHSMFSLLNDLSAIAALVLRNEILNEKQAMELTERNRTEDTIRTLNDVLESRLLALTQPVGDVSNIQMSDLFNIDELQKIQNAFAQATGVASIITDTQGRPITKPSNFCRLCEHVIRKTEKGLLNCYRSDELLGRISPKGPILRRCLSGSLWDAGTSICVGDRHIGNWLIGQVLEKPVDEEAILAYAKEIGADEEEFRKALYQVTRMPLKQFKKVANALYLIAKQLSKLAIQNVQQARFITERKLAEEALRRANRELRAISSCNQVLVWAVDEQALLNDVCRIICDEAGYRLVGVGYAENDDAKTVRPVTWAGFDSENITSSGPSWADDTEYVHGPAEKALRSGETIYVQNFSTTRQMAQQCGFRSVVALPLKDENTKVFGVLLVYSAEIAAIIPEEIRLLEKLSGDLAFGIMSLRARIERKQAAKEIRKLNHELELRVKERTAQLEIVNKELELFSYRDGMTGVSNRRHFDQQLEREWQRCSRRNSPLSLIMVDIDCFKIYNDCYGHLQGDECLKHVASCIASNARRTEDLVARYGGEEFIVLLPDSDIKIACALAEVMRSAVEALNIPHPASLVADHVTISLGVASDIPLHSRNSLDLVSAADRALYSAKSSGRNRVCPLLG